ncbi:MAG: type II toxin-antitoxin system VapC family toxin [Nitrospira sp.]|nr:type II toxin-antitoxin system VapC family toxin [Nitrospira sp.]
MRILLDTQLYLWYLGNTPEMTKPRRTRIEQADEIYISAASIWEAIIKIGLRRLEAAPLDLVAGIQGSGFRELPVTAQHTLALHTLPNHHRDPFDRLLIAQALSEPLCLYTSDRLLQPYSSTIKLI